VYSGGTWNPLEIDHAQPKTESLSLSVTPGRAPAGSPITLNATVTDGQGHALAGVPVRFQAVGPSQPVLAATSVQTDQQGHAQTSITAATEGGAVVTAAGNSPLTEDGAIVGWDKNQPQSQIIPLTLTALLVVLIGLVLILVRRRRHGAKST
jgi:Bacterial Ig-like domain (group 1)